MTHKSKVERFISRTKRVGFKFPNTFDSPFKQKQSPPLISKRAKFFSRKSIDKFAIDTDNENLFQQKKAKSSGR